MANLRLPPPRRPQAKDIPDLTILAAVLAVQGQWGVSRTQDVYRVLDEFPPKVVLAKLRAAARKRLIDGCGCGCRGDWHPTEAAVKLFGITSRGMTWAR